MTDLNATRLSSYIPRNPWIWCGAWLTWVTTLWFLSAGNPSVKTGIHIPHFDKIAHFCYFFAGAGLLHAWLHARQFPSGWISRHALTITAGAIIGALDEWHQAYTPGRSGNDIYDWTADLTGSIVGSLVMAAVLKKVNSYRTLNP